MTTYNWRRPPTLLASGDAVLFRRIEYRVVTAGSNSWLGCGNPGYNDAIFQQLNINVRQTAMRYAIPGTGNWPEGSLKNQTALVRFLLHLEIQQLNHKERWAHVIRVHRDNVWRDETEGTW